MKLIPVLLLCAFEVFAKSPRIPKVDIVYPPYGTIFDKTCSTFLQNETMTRRMMFAAGRLRPQLEAEWAREGPQYMAAALKKSARRIRMRRCRRHSRCAT